MELAVLDWDRNNLKKIRALSREPILIYEQDAGEEARYVY
jgi:hypothetical protein